MSKKLSPKKMFNEAMILASTYHKHQVDKGGHPYILHLLRVMFNLDTDDYELMCIALLHDIFEDTSMYKSILINMGFSERVISAIVVLTKVECESYDDYIDRISLNKDATLVKIKDIQDNMNTIRLKKISKKDIENQAKYKIALNRLTGV